MVNKERAKAGLQPLKPDPEMTNVARVHSRDMFARGYFAHVNPEGKDPFDRMKDAHVSFYAAGENLALAQTLEMAHTNLMNRPGSQGEYSQSRFWASWYWYIGRRILWPYDKPGIQELNIGLSRNIFRIFVLLNNILRISNINSP
jgi:hypothetical protein